MKHNPSPHSKHNETKSLNKTISLYVTSNAQVNLETRYGPSDNVVKALALATIVKSVAKKAITQGEALVKSMANNSVKIY